MEEDIATDREAEEAGKEETSSSADVLQAVVKTSKAFKMYLANNPLLRRFVDELNSKMGDHLRRYGEIKLDIDQFELRYKGKSVYENRDPKESLAFRMYSDGIRSLIFSEGMDENEIGSFLEIVGKERLGEVDDDIVTLLWMKDLPHVTYILAEDYLEFDTASAGAATPVSQQESIKNLYKSIPPPPPTPMMISQNILVLNDKEIDRLKKMKEAEEKKNPLDEVLHILSSILFVEKDISLFGDFAGITVNLISNLIHSGEINRAVNLIRFLKKLSGSQNLPPSHKEVLDKALEGTVSGEIIKDIEGIIDTTEKLKPEDLGELLLLLGKSSIRQMCELLGIVQKMEMRKVIINALIELGKDAPDAFYPFLTDDRWYLARNAVAILRSIGNPASMEPMSKLIRHKDSRVRKEVLLYMGAIPDPKAKAHFLKFLHDDESALRINALNLLAGSRFQEALKPLMEIVASKEFDAKDAAEKKAVFEALGEVGSDQVVPMFKEMLMKRYWFNKAKEKEAVMFAVSGLRRVRTDLALKALEEAGAAKKDEARTVINQAIRAINSERARASAK